MKKLLKIILAVLLLVVVGVVCLAVFLTVTEYRPADREELTVRSLSEASLLPPDGVSVLSWNIGYAGLGAQEDFFMDGGTHARPGSSDKVNRYLSGIAAQLEETDADLMILQEVDMNASRTYGIDETTALSRNSGAQALNYSCPFVPVPFPPMGKVHSGLFTTTDYAVTSAERIALPCPFSWPLSTANLKRCLLVTRHPILGSEKELVLVNLHLEAYDEGEGKLEQTRQLISFLEEEYQKGNYVIAGGDFNQSFPGSLDRYPNTHSELWSPGLLDSSGLPEGFGYVYDLKVPSCRLLNQPYDPADTVNTQYYCIDGFIISDNLDLRRVETLDLGFACSDHNPVLLEISFAA